MRDSGRTNDWDRDVALVTGELTSRLRTRGIDVFDSDTPDDLARLAEAVEAFETAVVEHGGDLMVDEPPRGTGHAQPDDPRFLLPTRAGDESVSKYIKRLHKATRVVREDHPPS